MIQVFNFLGFWASKIFTFDNLTFLLALIGSIGTAVDVLKSKRKLKFSLVYFGYSKEKNIAGAYIQIDNFSRLGISLTDVHLVIGDNSYPCRKIPTVFSRNIHKVGDDVVSLQDNYTISFPIQLSPLGGTSGYFVFDIPPGTELPAAKPRIFQVSANRGRAMKIELKPVQEYFEK